MLEPLIQDDALSVQALSKAIQTVIHQTFGRVKVRGEVSGLKIHTSGHAYLSLKDDQALIDAVCWRGTVGGLKHPLEEGLEIIATGRVTTYPARSKYQFIIEHIEPAGQGALLKLLQERKQKLEKEGLFDLARKRPLPYLPQTIGIITSETGAVIKDILHRLEDRFPVRVMLWPVTVQGETAPSEIIKAIQGFNALDTKPDLLIIARGGGSIEDLWAFNDEQLVREVAASVIPTISAVGHETDTMLIDYAADRRAPTPTAAAEMAVPVRADLEATVLMTAGRLATHMGRHLKELNLKLEGLDRLLQRGAQSVEPWAQRLDDLADDLTRAIQTLTQNISWRLQKTTAAIQSPSLFLTPLRDRFTYAARRLEAPTLLQAILTQKTTRIQTLGNMMEALSYTTTLKRGFAMIKDPDGRALTQVTNVHAGQDIVVEMMDGHLDAKVLKIK